MICKSAVARATGRSHLNKGIVCQDQVYRLEKNNVFVIALADGAGSKAFSDIGALISVKSACEFLADEFEKMYFQINEYKKKLENFIVHALRTTEYPFEQLSSTLLFVAISDKRCIWGHIGDGAIVQRDSEGMRFMSKPENSDYANQTFFTTDLNLQEHLYLQTIELRESGDVMLLSDGCEKVLVDSIKEVIAENCNAILDYNMTGDRDIIEKELVKILEQEICLRTNDDVSIALMHYEI